MARSDAQIANERQLESATQSDTVDGSHDGLGASVERGELGTIEIDLKADVVLAHPPPLLENGSGAESLVSRAGDDDRPDRSVRCHFARETTEGEEEIA